MPRLPIKKIGTLFRKGYEKLSDKVLSTSIGTTLFYEMPTKVSESILKRRIDSLMKSVSGKGKVYGFEVKGMGKYGFYPHPRSRSVEGLFRHLSDKEYRGISDVRSEIRFLLQRKPKKRTFKSAKELIEWLSK
jgi:hypothetical protein